MKIVYVGLKYNYYKPEWGYSFEHVNFFESLRRLSGVEVVYFPYERLLEVGKDEFNRELLGVVRKEKPDLFFAFMFTDELDFATLFEIKKITTSIAWCSDDHWRLYNYSRHYAPFFSYVITTWSAAFDEYKKYKITNVIRSQWACNHFLWRPADIRKDIDVSFVGQYNPARGEIVDALRSAGIRVQVRGLGWEKGRLAQDAIVEFLSRSKINLNLAQPFSKWRLRSLTRLFLKRSTTKIVPSFNWIDNFKSWRNLSLVSQIKARPFEILGCNAFLISAYADDIATYYEKDKEIIYYDGKVSDLIYKIKYYLKNDEARQETARAGYVRTIRDHTYERRFTDLFKTIGIN